MFQHLKIKKMSHPINPSCNQDFGIAMIEIDQDRNFNTPNYHNLYPQNFSRIKKCTSNQPRFLP